MAQHPLALHVRKLINEANECGVFSDDLETIVEICYTLNAHLKNACLHTILLEIEELLMQHHDELDLENAFEKLKCFLQTLNINFKV
jgi:hypothetical protein